VILAFRWQNVESGYQEKVHRGHLLYSSPTSASGGRQLCRGVGLNPGVQAVEVLLDQLDGCSHILTAGHTSARCNRNSLPLGYWGLKRSMSGITATA